MYWIILGAVIWHSEKKIAWLEEENRHLKELINIEKMREKEWRKKGHAGAYEILEI